VTLRYLRDGDCRPLYDAGLRGHAHNAEVLGQVAAMLDLECRSKLEQPPCYELLFDFEPGRRKGRPRHDEVPNSKARIFYAVLRHGLRALFNKGDPGQEFWRIFAAALDPGIFSLPEFPVRAQVRRIDRKSGRRRDPTLQKREEAIGRLVQKHRERGEKYDAAIDAVVKEIEAAKEEEGDRGRGMVVHRRIVRNAYDRLVGRTRKK
jgi:hypothetical protein